MTRFKGQTKRLAGDEEHAITKTKRTRCEYGRESSNRGSYITMEGEVETSREDVNRKKAL